MDIENKIKGQKIVEIRDMTIEEVEKEGWAWAGKVLILENGTKIYASCDDEGSSQGMFFVEIKKHTYRL